MSEPKSDFEDEAGRDGPVTLLDATESEKFRNTGGYRFAYA